MLFIASAFTHAAFKTKKLVIAGSHGKTSITSMIMHVENPEQGFSITYRANKRASNGQTFRRAMIVIEGDEYTTSPLDLAKFLHYKHM